MSRTVQAQTAAATTGSGRSKTSVQTRAARYICSNYGLKKEDLKFDGSTISTAETTFVPKLVLGQTAKVAVFFSGEVSRLLEDPDKSQVLFVPQDGGEVVQMPARALRENSDMYKGIRMVRRGPDLSRGENGEILLHLSRRTVNSNHYRINHVPMDSMLVFRDYSGHLSVSTVHGRSDFWLALRPENFGV